MMSDKPQVQDPVRLLAQLEKDWQELKELLHSRPGQTATPGGPGPQDLSRQANREGRTDTVEQTPTPQFPKESSRVTFTPMEVEAIVPGGEKVHGEAELLEHLAKVEKQNRRIAILGSMSLVISALVLGIAVFLLVQSHPLPKVGSLSAAPGIIQPGATASDSLKKQVSAQQPQTAATVRYVGSKTSNKYHFPDCKWAKTIAPERLRFFKSVQEAQEAGYIPCPACKPPVSD
jgi:hypothetical protein